MLDEEEETDFKLR